MVKKILLLLIVLSSIKVNSQNRFSLGLELGPSITKLKGDEFNDSNESLTTFNYGLITEYNLSKNLSIKSGINLETKGNTFNIEVLFNPDEIPTIIEAKNELDYTTIPLLLKYKTGNKLKFFVNSGPFVGFLRDSSRFGIFVKDIDAGLILGTGFQYSIKKNNLYLEFRSSLGLLDISDTPEGFFQDTINTRSYGLIVGYSYSL